jgi:hypothetical protein
MIAEEKQYEYVTGQLNYHNDKIIDAFNQFVKLVSAIIAGGVWIFTQQLVKETKVLIGKIALWLILLVCVNSVMLILLNLRAWWGYRRHLTNLVGTETVPPPRFPRSCFSELVMISVIVVTTLLLFIYLPVL